MNTILANNVAGGNGYGSMTDGGYNLSTDSSVPLSGTGSSVGVSPRLGPLANNGGPTLTMALLSGSPAIDTVGNNHALFPATDQRGVQRPVGAGADVGAYESSGSLSTSFSLLQPTLSSNRLSIVFPSQIGVSYVLQYKNHLTDSAWTSLSTNAGTGNYLTNQDLTTNQPARFYRVKAQ
jgi:hypothetical protein